MEERNFFISNLLT